MRYNGAMVGCEPFIPDEFAVLSGPHPPDALGFESDHLQILSNSRNTPWSNPGIHSHTRSDEAYLVLEGSISLMIEDARGLLWGRARFDSYQPGCFTR